MKSKKLLWLFSYEFVKLVFLFLFFGWSLTVAFAHQPVFPSPEDYNDYTEITDLNTSKSYYGNLNQYPHTYFFTVTEPTVFFAEVLVPEFVSDNNRSGILVKKEKRGVSEVTRLEAKNASWESFYEFWGGDSYRKGSTYETTLEPGDYIFEISTPDNIGKYVLVIGKEENFSVKAFFGLLRDIYKVKVFMEKPGIAVLQSPLYFVPITIVIIMSIWLWRRHRKNYA